MPKSSGTTRIEFRLQKDLVEELNRRAAETGARSANIAARTIVQNDLLDVRWKTILQELGELNAQIRDLRSSGS